MPLSLQRYGQCYESLVKQAVPVAKAEAIQHLQPLLLTPLDFATLYASILDFATGYGSNIVPISICRSTLIVLNLGGVTVQPDLCYGYREHDAT